MLLKRSLPELAIRPIAVLAGQSLAVAVGGSLAAGGVAAGLGLALGSGASFATLLLRIAAAGLVWLLTSFAIATVLRIGELRSMIGLMVDLVRRPRRA